MNELEFAKELENIHSRNTRVEIDKAWETSWTRKILIATITYLVASIWLWVIDETDILLKAVVPVAGYLLSTLSMPYIKKLWEGGRKKLNNS